MLQCFSLHVCWSLWAGIWSIQINNRSIQDLHIFGDPSRIPIVIVERVINAPLRSTSGNSYFTNPNEKDTPSLLTDIGSKAKNKSGPNTQQRGRVLKIVVFVHGFQVCVKCSTLWLNCTDVLVLFRHCWFCSLIFSRWSISPCCIRFCSEKLSIGCFMFSRLSLLLALWSNSNQHEVEFHLMQLILFHKIRWSHVEVKLYNPHS